MGRNNDYINQHDNTGTDTIGIEEGTNIGVREDITTSIMVDIIRGNRLASNGI